MSDTEELYGDEAEWNPMPDAAATLTFNIATPEGRFAHRCACRGGEMLLLLQDLAKEMRDCTKYGAEPCWPNPQLPEDVLHNRTTTNATEHWRERLRDLAHDHGVDLEDDI